MGAAGILGEDDRVELIEGEIIDMSPIGGPHAECVDNLTDRLPPLVPAVARLRIQNPVRIAKHTEVLPDISIVRRRQYGRRIPTEHDVLLLIEVADSTLLTDLNVKVPLYARAGIPEVWIVDVVHDVVIRYAELRDGVYQRVESFERGDTIVSVSLPSVALSVEAILG
jgi:Uma2 family endonuclease